ncbi:MAG: helix-turn-helix transcriptional regulator [Sphingopyxis sp.]
MMRIKGTDHKAVKAMVSDSGAMADYARLYPDTTRRIVEIITGVAGDYAAMGIALSFEVTDDEAARIDRLGNEFDLTGAEAMLALHIGGGGSLADYADAHTISRNTVRNQLQMVFDKTGVHRQAELVKLLSDF